jgi:uncharacterized protein (TIGR00730 family)
MKRLCVFCGSRTGAAPIYAEQARLLGTAMVRRGVGLVFGAGHVGLMGVLADAVREQGGETIGVIPQALVERELAHQALTDLRVVESMHDRKALMAGLSDAFLALPGGYGTLDELFEILTWAQLRFHQKPIGLLNTAGFFDPLLAWIERAIAEDFVKAKNRELLMVENDVERRFLCLVSTRHRANAKRGTPKLVHQFQIHLLLSRHHLDGHARRVRRTIAGGQRRRLQLVVRNRLDGDAIIAHGKRHRELEGAVLVDRGAEFFALRGNQRDEVTARDRIAVEGEFSGDLAFFAVFRTVFRIFLGDFFLHLFFIARPYLGAQFVEHAAQFESAQGECLLFLGTGEAGVNGLLQVGAHKRTHRQQRALKEAIAADVIAFVVVQFRAGVDDVAQRVVQRHGVVLLARLHRLRPRIARQRGQDRAERQQAGPRPLCRSQHDLHSFVMDGFAVEILGKMAKLRNPFS